MHVQIIIKLLSALGTPLHSDTLWGHLAWQLTYGASEEKLRDFLDSYRTTPTLISNGFPLKFLPKPVLPAATHQEMEQLIKTHFGVNKIDQLHGFNEIKRLRKLGLIEEKMLLNQNGPISEYSLLDQMLRKRNRAEKEDVSKSETVLTAHNTINRWTFGTMDRGGLFFTEDTFYEPETKFRIFMETTYFTIAEIKSLFSDIGLSGYGRDASTGKGAFTVESIEEVAPFQNEEANAVMSLSNFIPNENEHWDGYYNLITKYGKLGGDFVKDRDIPFKKPLVMLRAGSIFLQPEAMTQPVGALIKHIHFTDPDIVQYAYLFPLPIHIKTGKEAA